MLFSFLNLLVPVLLTVVTRLHSPYFLSSVLSPSLFFSCCHSSLANAAAPLRSAVLMFVSLFVFVPHSSSSSALNQ